VQHHAALVGQLADDADKLPVTLANGFELHLDGLGEHSGGLSAGDVLVKR
jgi:hypothetical protein